MIGELRNWAWCEHCLGWKDADEVSFIEMKEDVYGKDLLSFFYFYSLPLMNFVVSNCS